MSSITHRSRPRWGLRVTVLVLLAALIALLGASGVMAADRWTDISDAQWVSSYHVTAAQAATVAAGYPDGTFKPALAVTRGQFAKMAVDGLGLGTATPASPTFSDVPTTNTFFPWIEGGVDAGIISGFTDGTYRPKSVISRQQANSILGQYLSQKEMTARGHIAGGLANYASLNAWYAAEGAAILADFADATSVSAVHAPYTAYLIARAVVQGSSSGGNLFLRPGSNLTRAQAVALILRVKAVSFLTAVPTVTLLSPAFGPTTGGNSVVITGTNFTSAMAAKFGVLNATSFVLNSATQITAIAPAGTAGTVVDVTVTTPAGTSSTAGTGNDYSYGNIATAPSAIHLAVGTTLPVGGVTDVQIPAAGATDTHGAVTGWVAATASRIRFTVTDVSPAVSSVTINGVLYLSGTDYTIGTVAPLTIVVTTVEAGKTTAVRTFTVSVSASATAPSAIHLAVGTTLPVGGVTDVQIPAAGATDTHGAVTGWVATTANRIKFTVTDTFPAVSTLTINGVAYASGTDYTILAASPLTIVVTTTETGKTTAVRMFTVSVNSLATTPSAIHLAVGTTLPVAAVTDVVIPAAGATDTHGAVTGWVAGTASSIRFTVTDVSPAVSTITINSVAYLSGTDYTILAASPLTIVVTTVEAGKTTAVRTFTVSVAAPAAVNIAAIPGVTAPVTGATPVTTITATTQYTGTVTWSPVNNPFLGATVYTAFVTLTAKPGFTLTGVPANFFTVAGATTVSNPINSGVVTAVFPVTATTINIAAIPGVTAPVASGIPVTTITATAQYTGTVSWTPANNPFNGSTVYTATITLTAKPGFTLTGVAANFFTVAGASPVTNPIDSGVVTALFPTT